MKRITITLKTGLLLCMVLLSSISCEEVLDQTNPNGLDTEVFWETEEDAQLGLIGAYSPLSSVFMWGNYFQGHIVRRADEYTPGFGSPHFNGIFTDPTHIYLPNQWVDNWIIIYRANAVLKNVPDIEMDESIKNQILGQAYFLRAQTYFYVVNVWGNVPLVTEPAETSEDFFQPNSTPEAIWVQIKSDLEMAQSLLPENWPDNEAGRATWGAATAYLGKSYLYNGEWSQAAAEFKKIMDSGLYELTTNYGDNFSEATENNDESIWEIQFMSQTSGAAWGRDIPNAIHWPWFASILRKPNGAWINSVNSWVTEAFMEETDLDGNIDPRAYETIYWDDPQSVSYLGVAFEDSGLDPELAYPRKYYQGLPNTQSGLNYRLCRYADVLLMYAEALNEAGGSETEILNALNEVRARANMAAIPSGLGQSELRNRIRNERILELSLETDRYFDLVRWGVVVDRMNGNADKIGNIGASGDVIRLPGHIEYGFPFAEMHILSPIPQAEIDANPMLQQNPGY